MVGRKDRDGLVDAVLLVLFEMFHPPLLDEFDHPSRIQVDAKADSASVLAQVLDGKPQTAWAGWSEHEPIGTFGKVLIRKSVAKEFVIDSEVIDDHSAFGDPGRPTGFEDIGWFAGKAFGDPAFDRSATQQLVLENREFL